MSRQWSDLGPIKIKIKTFTCKFQSRHGPVPCCSHSRWTHPRWLSCLDQPEQKQLRWTRQQSKIFLFFSLRELLGPQLFCSDRIATRTCSIASRDVFPSLRFTTNISNATFLSDPSPIIGNACQWLTPSLTNSCLVNLIDLTLACEDANSKLVEVVTIADDLDLKLMLGRDSEDEIWSRFVFELVIWPQEAILVRWTQASGPLCLWQCLWNPQCPIKLADIKKSAKYPIRIVGQLDLWILLFQWSSSHLHHLLSLVRIGQPPLLMR